MSKCNTIKNVFICEKENSLKLVDIEYSSTILKIIPFSNKLINWNDINTDAKRSKFLESNGLLSDISSNETVIDGSYNLLIPGGIDPHVHFDTPGFEFRDDFEHGSAAAAYGGTTTVIDMPCTSLPPVTSHKNLAEKLACVKERSVIDFAFWGGVRGNDFFDSALIKKQIFGLADKGVAGFKAYFTSGMESFTDLTFDQMLETAKYIKETGKILAVHAEDKQLIDSVLSKCKETLGTWQAYCKARSVEAESKAVQNLVKIAKLTGCKIHVVHLSSAEALAHVEAAQKAGLEFTAETCPHYLHFTQNDFKKPEISAFLKTAPPVKSSKDRSALWQGLADGSLSFVTTDHAGSLRSEKSSKDFRLVYGGIPGVEHRVEFMFSEGLHKNKLTLEKTIQVLSSNSASFFSLFGKGKIKPGYDADFAMVNLWNSHNITSKNVHAKGKYTPFDGTAFNAVVEQTILRGNPVMNRITKFLAQPGDGKFIRIK